MTISAKVNAYDSTRYSARHLRWRNKRDRQRLAREAIFRGAIGLAVVTAGFQGIRYVQDSIDHLQAVRFADFANTGGTTEAFGLCDYAVPGFTFLIDVSSTEDPSWWHEHARYGADGWLVIDRGVHVGRDFYAHNDIEDGLYRYTNASGDNGYHAGRFMYPVLNRDTHTALFQGNYARPVGGFVQSLYPYIVYRDDKDTSATMNTRMQFAHDVVAKDGAPAPLQVGVIGVAIGTNTTVSAKRQYCGCLTYYITGSTLGTGDYQEHEFHWAQGVFQNGQDFTILDPRPGAQQGAVISGRDGHLYGSIYTCPMLASGNHAATGYGEDWGGNTDNASTSNTNVAAAPTTVRYVTASGAGANDGTSLTDAWDPDDVTTNLSSTDDVLVLVLDGETLAPTTLTTMAVDNFAIMPCDSNGDVLLTGSFTVNADTASWVRPAAGSENWTEWGKFKQKTGGAHTVIVQNGGCVTDGLYANCGIDNSLGRAKAFIEVSATAGDNRYMVWNADCEGGADRYCIFSQVECVIFGGIFSNATGDTERPFRFNNNGSMDSIVSAIGIECDAEYKDCIRLHESQYSYVYRCYLICSGTTTGTNGVWINENGGSGGDNKRVRITHCVCHVTTTGSGSGILWQDGTDASDQTLFLGWNVVIQDNAGSRAIDIDNGCYKATVVGNTCLSASTSTTNLRVVPTQDCLVYGNLLKYDGAATSAHDYLAVSSPAGTLEVENNIAVAGNNTNATPWNHGGSSYNLANFNAISGIADNDEDTVTVDGDYVSDADTYTPPAQRDFYGNDIGGASARVGAVEGSAPAAPSISSSTPADAATGVLTSRTAYDTVWTDEIAYASVAGSIAGGGEPASIDQDDWLIDSGNRDEATLTVDLSGATGEQTLTIDAGSFYSRSTGIYNEEIVRTFTMASAPTTTTRSRVRGRTRGSIALRSSARRGRRP